MKKNCVNIILSLLLTVAVTDYVWYDLLSENQIAIEFETDKEEESKEEVREVRSSESRHETLNSGLYPLTQSFSLQTISSGIINYGNSYRPLAGTDGEKLIILHCQLRLPC